MRFAPFLLILAGCVWPAARAQEPFRRHIAFLASDEMRGRNNDTEEGRRAAQYVADQFQAVGLRPGGIDGSWFQDFETKLSTRSEKIVRGRNVAGILPGGDLAHEFVVLGAHHDARGVINGKIQNGADDNASGVAMIIELARAFARAPARRTLVFVTFDAEEDGLIGSREYVKAKLVDPGSIAATFIFDLVGGDFLPWERRRVYALGSEYSGELWDRVGRMAAAEPDLDVARLGVYLIEMMGPRSDYAAYRAASVPFIFLTTATPWYYHTPHDDTDVLNYDKIVHAAAFVERLVRETADDPARPIFRPRPPPDFVFDAGLVREGVTQMLERMRLSDGQRAALRRHVRELEAVIAAPSGESGRALQRVMTSMFTIVLSQRAR
ncbi:MAG: M28 family peptidase [Planctomycetes bacterium]|nr:M28 family peptidase [Planctomycetota bacterium]